MTVSEFRAKTAKASSDATMYICYDKGIFEIDDVIIDDDGDVVVRSDDLEEDE